MKFNSDSGVFQSEAKAVVCRFTSSGFVFGNWATRSLPLTVGSGTTIMVGSTSTPTGILITGTTTWVGSLRITQSCLGILLFNWISIVS